MKAQFDTYFGSVVLPASSNRLVHQKALERCLERLQNKLPTLGVRNPKIGIDNLTWSYCRPGDWVISFLSGQLWLGLQLTGDSVFLNAARARRSAFRDILRDRRAQNHDLGFQFSLSCVADWRTTGSKEAREMALEAARNLLWRYCQQGKYIQAWNARPGQGEDRVEFVAGRMIADTMQNLALLYWAADETGNPDFSDVANGHAETTAKYLVREDDTSFHTFVFDKVSGRPLRGETHQGYAHDSCWSRGQAWMIHGFAQSALTTRNDAYLDIAKRLAAKAENLMGSSNVPVWDFGVPDSANAPRDSSAGAIMAAGVYIIADLVPDAEAARWKALADRLLQGLLDECDLTKNPQAEGLLAHGAAHVTAGYADTMLPYGDYYFMEALMRSLGHTEFFW
ncbi:Glycosyl Hydrolase Family 88 [Phyllobacterium sp. YR531]|nr:Glycosyl Hydrolase Family 88 [Phyllobacterium sp. YR531]